VEEKYGTGSAIRAVLGPTNTGKTYLAMERMLGHRSGMIGFPLRLLARENYDRAVAVKGADKVALVTGEEKILPPDARYYLCTVEAMPLDLIGGKGVEFLAIDEIQVAGDPDRGHVFTDRLLHARGTAETMFLGAESMRPIIQRLVPGAEFSTRPRLSKLAYSGIHKLNRLKPRSAVVAFTANDVYALAEILRRQKGGAAVVLGALSPRTRNAQVALYQEGDVDYLVATDAIGMGLNMDVRHVTFASTRKFDGKRFRTLRPDELAQIAGRAGRHANDGTFGITPEAGGIAPEAIERIEEHRFEALKHVYWRNADLDFAGVQPLLASLRERAGRRELARVREADDERTLAQLGKDADIARLAADEDGLRLLWEVCQVPDFEKQWSSSHARFLEQVFRHLRSPQGCMPKDWVAEHIERIDRTDGSIDTLSGRIARIRTWTYMSHKTSWMDDARHWQERSRAIEDRLSDALHESLTQRFVDKRTTALIGGLREKRNLTAAVRRDGEVLVEGQYVGRLDGLRFHPDETRFKEDRRTIMGAVMPVMAREVRERVANIEDSAFEWRADGTVLYGGEPVARALKGDRMLAPRIRVFGNPLIEGSLREDLASRIDNWIRKQVETNLAPLVDMPEEDISAPVRGLLFQLRERFGVLARADATDQIVALGKADRKRLQALGITLGRETVYMSALLKPAAVALRARLWSIWHTREIAHEPPPPGAVSVDVTSAADHRHFLEALGYRTFDGPGGTFAVRIDMVERLASRCWRLAKTGPFTVTPELASLTGRGIDGTAAVLKALGFRKKTVDGEVRFALADPKRRKPSARKTAKPRQPKAGIDPASPFAGLAEHFGSS